MKNITHNLASWLGVVAGVAAGDIVQAEITNVLPYPIGLTYEVSVPTQLIGHCDEEDGAGALLVHDSSINFICTFPIVRSDEIESAAAEYLAAARPEYSFITTDVAYQASATGDWGSIHKSRPAERVYENDRWQYKVNSVRLIIRVGCSRRDTPVMCTRDGVLQRAYELGANSGSHRGIVDYDGPQSIPTGPDTGPGCDLGAACHGGG